MSRPHHPPVDDHIAHEDHSNDGPVGGVPDAEPAGDGWVDTGGAYGGLRTRVPTPGRGAGKDQADETADPADTAGETEPVEAPITVPPLPSH